ncbi:acyl-CoA reductase-like NAD-dependent aldehyde dehydrogenase [Bradyrhizobium sp. LM2.7]
MGDHDGLESVITIGWNTHSAKQRSNILPKWYELIVANREDLALILTSEQGKPLVDTGGVYVEFYTEEARRIYGETFPRRARMQGCLRSSHRLASAAPLRRGTFPTR